jgi:predicted peptidase
MCAWKRGLLAVALGFLACCTLTTGGPARAGLPERPAARQATAAATPKGFLLKTIKQGDEEYRYVVYVPANYEESKPWPAIIFLNGAGECGRDGLKAVAVGLGPAVMLDPDHWPFLVLIPQKPDVDSTWAAHDALVMAMLDATKREYKVDTTRLYLTGLSQGGFGTWAIAIKHPDLFAAIAPICGGGNAADAAALKDVPVWAFHGDADTVVPHALSEEMVEAVKKAGGDATLTLFPGVGHNSWDRAYRESQLYDWLLKHKRAAK